ncbi:2-hydroxyacid dehydrogenase [Phreatobacter stygius]|uniref:D-glycerate dehydrogenase n=1 Tax=Phreatobacter stygius TaxID=1940610 RepID=A0A4D7BEE5_9HYPH|nr:D-glycerate dehydrogenase [Phreatobacter stygius]QCI66307.1 D-glycerate dehydrogenase [Phreatobacter stygius]
MKPYSVLVACQLPEAVERDLASALDVDFMPDARQRPVAELVARLDGRDALLLLAMTPADAALIEALPASVKAIATYSVGLDHIDLAAARKRGIAVLHTPDVLTDAVAETALLLLLGAARRATESIDLVRSGAWQGWTPTQLIGVELSGKTLGILGMGRIGRGIAERARAFGMTICYHNRSALPPDLAKGAVHHADAVEFLGAIDALAIACPLTEATRGFLDAERIAAMKPGAIVVNIARGPVIDDDALIAALQSGHVRAAGLDVFTNEPKLDPRYLNLGNAFLLPHIGSSTVESRRAMGRTLIDGFAALAAGRNPDNRVV